MVSGIFLSFFCFSFPMFLTSCLSFVSSIFFLRKQEHIVKIIEHRKMKYTFGVLVNQFHLFYIWFFQIGQPLRKSIAENLFGKLCYWFQKQFSCYRKRGIPQPILTSLAKVLIKVTTYILQENFTGKLCHVFFWGGGCFRSFFFSFFYIF